jgi:hypothetical protein
MKRKETGVPLNEAYRLVAFGPERAEFEDLAKHGYTHRFITVIGGRETAEDRLLNRGVGLKETFEQAIVNGLRNGELIATARDTRLPITSGRLRIPTEAWQIIELDFFREKGVADGHDILDLRIRYADPNHHSILFERAFEKWMRELADEHPERMLRDEVQRLAEPLFPGLPSRAFERVWKLAAPPEWRVGGRPKPPH